jgi:hypothetical protein
MYYRLDGLFPSRSAAYRELKESNGCRKAADLFGIMPTVLGIGAIAERYNGVLYHETLLKRNVAF